VVNGGSNYDSLNGALASIESTAGATITHLVVHLPRTSIESIVIAGQPIKTRLCGCVKTTGKRRE